jgi:hypothetical protein
MMIDPAFYVREPLVHIEYLPLREAYLAMAFPGDTPEDADARLRWKKLTRISPAMIEAFSTDLFNQYADSAPYREGIQKAERANDLFVFGVNNLLLIAPDSPEDSWHHIAEAGVAGGAAGLSRRRGLSATPGARATPTGRTPRSRPSPGAPRDQRGSLPHDEPRARTRVQPIQRVRVGLLGLLLQPARARARLRHGAQGGSS